MEAAAAAPADGAMAEASLSTSPGKLRSTVRKVQAQRALSPTRVDCHRMLTEKEKERISGARRSAFRAKLLEFTKQGGAVASFSGMPLDERQVQNVINGVLSSTSVTVLNFDGVGRAVGKSNIGGVATVLSSWAKLHVKEVTVAGCEVGPKGCRQIAEGLLNNPYIEFLSLKDNDITNEGHDFSGLALLSRALSHEGPAKDVEAACKSLKRLDVSGCALSDHGLVELIPIIRTNFVLYQFNTARNLIGEGGAEHILEALNEAGKRSKLCHMELHGNLISLSLTSKIKKFLGERVGKKFLSERLAKGQLARIRTRSEMWENE